MSKLIIQWWKPLRWSIKPVPNKNSILKLIPATVLTDEPVVIKNVPHTSDVRYLLQILEKLWWKYERISNDSIRIDNSWLKNYKIDAELSNKIKASVMFTWPLLVRFWQVEMPTPQWCKLWTRPLDALVDNIVKMWADFEHKDWVYKFKISNKKLIWQNIRQRFPSVTWTENLILMAVLAQWTTEIYNAACEPHTQDLCNMLVSMWANIEWIWSNKLTIHWVKKLKWTQRTVIPDHLDVWWYIVASVLTWWEVLIQNAWIKHMWMILQVLEKLWVHVKINKEKDEIFVPSDQPLIIQKTVKWNPRRTHARAWPLLPPDFVHSCVVLALKANWQAIFDNLFYEYGRFFVQELAKMKANVIMANPVTVITTWPTKFKSANLVCSDIIQASYALLLAAMSAEWTSTLNSIKPLFRRFPDFVEKFNSLGAKLQLIDEDCFWINNK